MISGTSVVSDFDEASPISQDAIAPGVIIKSSIPKNAFKVCLQATPIREKEVKKINVNKI